MSKVRSSKSNLKNDLWGFGRRRIDTRPDDLESMVAYQIGALQAMAAFSDGQE